MFFLDGFFIFFSLGGNLLTPDCVSGSGILTPYAIALFNFATASLISVDAVEIAASLFG